MDNLELSQLERYKARLESERLLIMSELEEWLKTQTEQQCQALFSRLRGLSQDDLLEFLQQLEFNQAKKYCKRLRAIDASLCQFELGLYGFCADCEASIEPEQLQRDPTAQRCNACHRQHIISKEKNKHRILL